MSKVSSKEIFAGFKSKLTFVKKTVLQLLWRTAKIDEFYGICLVLTKEMA